jgi:hypothetical protein
MRDRLAAVRRTLREAGRHAALVAGEREAAALGALLLATEQLAAIVEELALGPVAPGDPTAATGVHEVVVEERVSQEPLDHLSEASPRTSPG